MADVKCAEFSAPTPVVAAWPRCDLCDWRRLCFGSASLPHPTLSGGFLALCRLIDLNKLSVPLAFKVGPAPHIKPASKSPAKPKSTKPVKAVTSKRKVVKVQPRAVQADQTVTTSGSNGHLIDQADHALVEERLFKKRGH
jgi:hypothetical protein